MKVGKLEIGFEFGGITWHGLDDFEMLISKRSWGIRFSYWKYKSHFFGVERFTKEYLTERKELTKLRDHFRKQEAAIEEGNREDPLYMSVEEQHEHTSEMARRLKFSEDFEYHVKTPMVLQCLERGFAFDPLTNRRFSSLQEMEDRQLIPIGSAKDMKDWTRGNFMALREEYKQHGLAGATQGETE